VGGLAGAGAEAAGSDHTGVDGVGGFGHHCLAYLRTDAVGPNDEVAFRRGAVGEMGDNGPVREVINGDEAFVVVHSDAPIFGAVDD
jgi:hypothetical protein